MAITLNHCDDDRVLSAQQSLRALGPTTDGENILTNGAILGLTTVQGLIDLVNNAARFDCNDHNVRGAAVEAILEMQAYGVFTNTNIAAADTFAGVILLLTNAVPADRVEFMAKHYGAENQQGNYGQPNFKLTANS